MTAQPYRPVLQQPYLTTGTAPARHATAAPWRPATSARPRTPLSLVPAPDRRRSRGVVLLSLLVLVAALLSVLVVNIAVSNRQYELVSLRQEQNQLHETNQRLSQEAELLAAPQSLAARATELGLVHPGSVAAIDLSTGTVTGEATAAVEGDVPSSLVAAPTTTAQSEPDAAQTPAVPAAEQFADEAALNGGTIPAPQLKPAGE